MKVDAIQQVLNKNVSNLNVLVDTLENENIGSVYARSTKISRIRNAIMEQLPVFINFGNTTYAVVGEDENELVLLDKTGLYANVPDNLLQSKWNGEAVFVTGEQKEIETTPNSTLIIYDPIKSNWTPEQNQKLFQVLQILSKLDSIDKKFIPQTSVILNARKPDKEERKDHQVAFSIGYNITVLLDDNILEAVLHELGHVYWNTLLAIEEKYDWKDMVAHINLEKQDTVPKIIKNPYEVSSGEELFCTTYAWYLMGLIFNEGYLKILSDAFIEGKKKLDAVFDRVSKTINEQNKFQKYEPLLKQYLKTLRNEPIVVNANHTKLFKAVVTNSNLQKLENEIRVFPPNIPVGLLKSSMRRSHFQILDGRLKDFVLVTNNITGNLDWEFMRENPNELKILHKTQFDKNVNHIVMYGNSPVTLCKAIGKKLPEPMKLVKTENGQKIVYNSWRKAYEGSEVTTSINEKSKEENLQKGWSFFKWFSK